MSHLKILRCKKLLNRSQFVIWLPRRAFCLHCKILNRLLLQIRVQMILILMFEIAIYFLDFHAISLHRNLFFSPCRQTCCFLLWFDRVCKVFGLLLGWFYHFGARRNLDRLAHAKLRIHRLRIRRTQKVMFRILIEIGW